MRSRQRTLGLTGVRRWRHHENVDSKDVPQLVRWWLWKFFARMGFNKGLLFDSGSVNNPALAKAMGLGHWVDVSDFLYEQAEEEFSSRYKELEKNSKRVKAPQPLRRNVLKISRLLGLSKVECRILEFLILSHNLSFFRRCLHKNEMDGGRREVAHFFSQLFDLPEKVVLHALSSDGMLIRSGMLACSFDRFHDSLPRMLEVKPETLAVQMFCEEIDTTTLLRFWASPSAPPELSLADYTHFSQPIDTLRAYLKIALATKRKGVNVFVYGPPGTGKTQLARVLAKDLSCELFEVLAYDEEKNPISGEDRLRYCSMAQVLLQNNAASLLLFDEIEDSIVDEDFAFFRGGGRRSHYGKACRNQLLEENPVPTIWVSNSHAFDPAFLRRFDVVLEMPVPPKKQRARILHSACADLFSPSEIGWVAESESLAPAVVTRAASVARLVQDELGQAGARSAFELLVASTLEAQGHTPPRKHDPNRLPEVCDPAFLHTDTDLSRMTEGLLRTRTGRLCLYGPPGTGKTAFGRFLAEQLGAPLHAKRASDLLSKWLGESEKNIARAFRSAEQEGGVLLIDEADTFLQDRRGAERSWEIALVNEMLTQIESFSGVLIVSTNLHDVFDQAAFRRFDLKVKFDFLKPEQAAELLRRYCQSAQLSEPSSDEIARVLCLASLTPGDFATVMRQSRLAPLDSCTALLTALEAEVALKQGPKAAIGFLC